MIRLYLLCWDLISSRVPPQGRFTIAAKHHISVAEIYESDLLDIDKVSEFVFGFSAEGG